MPIRLHAEHTGRGVSLKRIATPNDAESLRLFFAEKGSAATVSPFSVSDHRVFLPGMTMDQFAKLIEAANIELIP